MRVGGFEPPESLGLSQRWLPGYSTPAKSVGRESNSRCPKDVVYSHAWPTSSTPPTETMPCGGFEPPRPFEQWPLRPSRLPTPPTRLSRITLSPWLRKGDSYNPTISKKRAKNEKTPPAWGGRGSSGQSLLRTRLDRHPSGASKAQARKPEAGIGQEE